MGERRAGDQQLVECIRRRLTPATRSTLAANTRYTIRMEYYEERWQRRRQDCSGACRTTPSYVSIPREAQFGNRSAAALLIVAHLQPSHLRRPRKGRWWRNRRVRSPIPAQGSDRQDREARGFPRCAAADVLRLHALFDGLSDRAAQLRQLERQHGAQLGTTRIVIISVDGERDTPEAMQTWLKPLSPNFIGLTGAPAQVHTIA